MSRRLIAAVTTTALTITLSTGAAIGAAATDDDKPDVPKAGDLPISQAQDKISPALAAADGEVTVFVELDATSGVDTAEAGGSTAAVEAAADDVEALAAEVVDSADSETIAVTTDLVPGVVVRGDAAELRALAAKDGVTSIRVMTPKVPMNKGTDVFTKAMDAWTQTGFTGKDVTIGVIDTGLDYTHADFGGPGTAEAYATAYASDTIPAGLYDPAKFLGGWDFAGPTYDAGGSGDQLVPHPDANPIDSPEGSTPGSSHGSHVAGTAAGYGVAADGTTFTGDYSTLTDISDFQIGPGSAPEAGIYALKVFGDAVGSTNLTVQALEWAADPNNDGDYSDHLDIVNMSLGSDYGPADDPENDFIDQLSKLGVLSVVASGNASDVVDVGGTPGNAASALTVANSVGTSFLYDAVEVTSGSASVDTGLYGAQNTIAYTGDDVTADVVYIGDVEGCDNPDGSNSLEPYRDQIEGKIVYLLWPEPGFSCGSVARWTNAAEAGAAGAIVGWEGPVFTYGLTGSSLIPGAMLTANATSTIVPALKAGEQITMHMGPGLANAVYETNPDAGDLVNDSSSRGVHGSLGIVKPDVAAPGTSISSVASSTGNGATTKSGTSMATPHVAGLAALVREAHPRWTALQVKAAVMNTATHDLYTDPGQTGDVYAPERVGSGRVDALAAVTDDVIAYAKADPSLVSVTFGVVNVGTDTVTKTAKVTVKNMGRTTHYFDASFLQATGAGGATITVSPSSFKLTPNGTQTVKVTLTADPASLAKEIDPTSDPSALGLPREFVTTISGRLVLTDTADGSTLRVPVQAAPRLVSDMSTDPVVFDGDVTAPVNLTGQDALSGGWYSIVSPMVLGAESPVLPDDALPGVAPSAVKSGDLRFVGASSTAPQYAAAGEDPSNGMLNIGIAVEGEWTSLGSVVYPVIDIDVDGDDVPDYETIVWKYTADVDLTTVETYEVVDTGAGLSLGGMVDLELVNGLPASFQTTIFDNNVLVAPIWLGALDKLEPGMTPTFSVQTWSGLWDGGPIDVADTFSFDPYAPAFWFDDGSVDSTWYIDTPGTAFTVHRAEEQGDASLLMLHAINKLGSRAEVVPVSTEARADVELSVQLPRRVTTRDHALVKVTLTSDAVPSGTVQVSEGSTVLASGEVRIGRHGEATAAIRLPKLSAGDHTLTVSYLGNVEASPASTDVALRVWSTHGRWTPC
ncbi:S8 family serine peptidase [Actinotalea sp. M2MS4P-6]|uniref:S8 family serine peptidase n=1 Tax=Actinotalea sp. M2MS4P-6 TaxID=2983762 RepID=UPI0021E3884D|nr:S8 family serine peptidase [Actinotalea sp. M2MS4P-6]MCV2394959.1 S8 family serine peptidase [Actinotalea sp. M2MS4P-6]